MSGVIYADVLVVINFYVTYFLLLSAAALSKENPGRIRLALTSLFGGFYALLPVFLPQSRAVKLLLQVGAIILPVVLTFGFKGARRFFKSFVSYLLCSFLFAGLMLGVWYFFSPPGMYYSGSVVYFDIDLKLLVILTIVSYGFLRLFDFIFKSRAPTNTIFYLRIILGEKSFNLRAFLDTGNKLKDPFTSSPVIIADKRAFRDSFTDELNEENPGIPMRYILCSCLSGKKLLPAFFAEKVQLKGADGEFTAERVMIALTEERLFGGEYDAILPLGLFDNYRENQLGGENDENTTFNGKNKALASKKAFSVSGLLHKRPGESSAAADKGEGK